MFTNERYNQWIYRSFFLLLWLLIIFLLMKLYPFYAPALHLLFKLLVPFVVAMFIAYLLHPTIERLHEMHVPRWAAITIIYLLFFGGVGYAVYMMYPIFLRQLSELVEQIPSFVDTYREYILKAYERTAFLPEKVHDRMDELLQSIEARGEQLLVGLGTRLTGMLDVIIFLAVIPVLVFYMLKDFTLMKKTLFRLTPAKYRKEGKEVLQEVDDSLGHYIRGQLLVCLFVGGISIVLLWFIGMRYPLVLGGIMGVTNIIPYFGPILGAIPALVIAFTVSTRMVVFVLIVVLAVQLIESNLLSPYIVGRSLHMHPILIIFALLIGGEIAGIVGMIIAVPALTILRVFAHHTDVFPRGD
ncbi:hypothetical protein N781_10895 [Pontibacillus halophilus JSM 076056 = DSM 19796]|uniref:AI-2E family transporter n=1 Tax=Pontibacillus halophilus JSM 076056 = DSM 19796 TaxID=1385510 RepID=A0A0A5ICI7_9BACI|nr:AI-2E family transporter [Pontibacillus halophilus]KGX93532.1 hypothetical protein N781_10895 [Pontibacillus halophilus JSM 076056 = DSM 19796]